MNAMSKLITFLPVIVVVIVIVLEKLRQNRIRNEYDEMQLEIRGKGAWYGFYTIILYWAVLFLVEYTLEIHFLSAQNAVFLGIMISGSVIVGYSILHDSYYGMNHTGGKYTFLFLIAGIELLSITYLIRLVTEGMFADLKTPCMDERLMLPMCIPLFTTILVTTWIRRIRPEEGEE